MFRRLRSFLVRKSSTNEERFWDGGGAGGRGELGSNARGYHEAFKQCVWVRRCVALRAAAVASVPLKLTFTAESGEQAEVTSHPVLDLLNSPNPFDIKNLVYLLTLLEMDLSIDGEALWALDPPGLAPRAILRLMPRYVEVKRGVGAYVGQYEYRLPGRDGGMDHKPEDVVHFRSPNPDDPYRGLSPLSAVMGKVNAELQGDAWNAEFFRNGARPAGFLSLPAQDTLQAKEVLEYFMKVQSEMHGGLSRQGRIGVVPGGSTWLATGATPKDADFLQLQARARDAICAAMGVPVFMVSGHEAANYATAAEQRASFWEDTILPELAFIADTLNGALLPRFGEGGLRLEFDVTTIPAMIANEAQQVKLLGEAVKAPIYTINEARLRRGMDTIAGGDDILVAVNQVPLGAVADTGPSEEEAERRDAQAEADRLAQGSAESGEAAAS